MTRNLTLALSMSHDFIKELMSERVSDVNSGIAPQDYALDLLRDLLNDSGHVMQKQIDYLMQRGYNSNQRLVHYQMDSEKFTWEITFADVSDSDITMMYLLYPESNAMIDL